MADIKFTGFVEDWTKNSPQHPDWAMRVSEPHRKKDGDTWVTIGRTYRTIKGGWESGIDFSQFKKGDLVEIVGKELTESSEKDGKRYDNLVVKADTVVVKTSGSAVKTNSVPVVDDSAPF
jgi:hypothetical protein